MDDDSNIVPVVKPAYDILNADVNVKADYPTLLLNGFVVFQ